MTATLEIICDAIRVRREGGQPVTWRVLSLVECEQPGLRHSLDFILDPEDERRFLDVFARDCLGRTLEVSLRQCLPGFAGRLLFQGRVHRVL